MRPKSLNLEERHFRLQHRIWNDLATDEARRLGRSYDYWPQSDTRAWRRNPLIVHTGPTGRVNTGGHTT